ncbi:MAG: hypothetical protein MUQ32_14190 [Chloroflexi bacterium]|nr:hypothetical protein [Chloroflexota bacterium]
MPPQAYALVTLFMLCSVALGVAAVRVVARAGGPRGRAAYLLPIAAACGAFYLIGHRLGLAVGPEISLFGFQVALLGDLAIGFAASLATALAQAAAVKVSRRPA